MTFTNFIKRPVLSTVISIFFVLLGTIGLISLPVEQYPNIAPPTISVSTTYTGADAQTVLNSVIAPLEESINGVENMTYMTSSASNSGYASITVYFKQGSDPDMAAVNVQNRVSQAQALLPAEVTKVGVTVTKRQSSNVILFSLTSEDGRYDDEFVTNYALINVIPQLKRINGVGDVQSPSTRSYSMRIWLKPEKMKEFGLIPSDISGALAEQNIEAAPGSFGESTDMQYEYTLRYKGRLKTPTEYENILIKSNTSGQTLRLGEVAKVELGGLTYSVNLLNNGQPAVMGMVQQIAGSNATQIANDVKKELKELSKNFPPGLEYTIEQDITEFLFASIEEVVFTLIITLVLVFFVVYIFLQDFRSTLIPMIAVPVALIGAFFFLWVFGFSINLLTLSALLLAIAIVVDDAIVVVEAVHAKLDQGYKSALTASIDAMNEISSAIISITLVMSAVFIPVSFIGGTSGYFYREFGVTMAVSILISAVNALTLSPALCAIFLKPHEEGAEKKLSLLDRFHAGFNYQFDKITNKYKKGVQWVIGHGMVAAGIVTAGIAVMVVLMNTTKTGLVPDEDTGTLFACISTAPGTSQERTAEIVKQVDKMLAANPAIQRREAIMGYSFIGGAGSNQGTVIIKLKPFDERPGGFFHRVKSALTGGGIEALFVNPMESTSVLGMIYKQTATIKDAQILAFGPPMITGFSAQSGITMTMQDKTGGDLDKFFENVKTFLAALNKRPEIQTAQTQYNPNYPQYMVDVDVAKTKQAGISPSSVLSVMQGYLGGLYASNFNSFGKLYRVMIQAGPESRMRPDDLSKMYVRCADGTMSPVSEFVNLRKVYGPANITRFNLFTSMDVSVTPNSGYSTGDGMKAIAEVAKETLPEGYSYEYSGLTRSEAESSNSTGLIFALCIVFVYLILSAQYESYILPLSVVLSIPFGLAGAFIFTNLFGHSNDIYMQISLIMLVGLLAKNAILIVQFALERRRTGMAIKYSAILGAGARLRPILMTSLAMVIGLLPLMFASGVGKNGNQTLGAAAVGGMLIGTLLQVFIVPALFTVFQWLQEKLTPLRFEDEENEEANAELLQYAEAAACKKK